MSKLFPYFLKIEYIFREYFLRDFGSLADFKQGCFVDRLPPSSFRNQKS